jgi:hydroxyethylthiazole kinase-like uncharacterized protein yjeF
VEPIVTPEEMGAIDAAASEPTDVLVGRAGAAVAREALRMLGGGYGRRVVVLAGKGNNGADGRAAAERLRSRGVRVTVIDAADAPAMLPAADLVIDAAYGTGFRGEYHPPELPSTTRTEGGSPTPTDRCTPPVLAVDIPSGVSGLTGEASGSPWTANRTVTFAARKPGLLLGAGPVLAGEVVVADIGLDASSAGAWLVTTGDVARWIPERAHDTHKWTSAVWVVAGSPGMTGSAHLATRAAQRAGAGYVRLATPGSEADPFAPTEAVVVSLPEQGWAGDVLAGIDRFRALAVGPGLGTGEVGAAEVRRLVVEAQVAMVVDGDGLRALGRDAADVIGRRPVDFPPVVLTPHGGEWEALTGSPPPADRFAAVRALAAETGAVVLLKGSTTIVADPAGTVLVSTSGDARLASAGTGDVLTGTLAALLAQGLPGVQAAAAAAHLHGRAGALAWRRGLVAGDVVHHLPVALAELLEH